MRGVPADLVGQHGTAVDDISDGIHTRHTGLEAVIHNDVLLLVHLHPKVLQAHSFVKVGAGRWRGAGLGWGHRDMGQRGQGRKRGWDKWGWGVCRC